MRARLSAVLRVLGAACLGLLLAGPVRAQAPAADFYWLTWWNSTKGLPQNSINALLQTEDGQLWIATFGGLLRFDGIEFRIFDLDTLPGLQSNRITALASDGAGGLWFGTQIGNLLQLHDGQVREFVPLPPPGDEVLSLARAVDGSLWVQGSTGRVYRYAAGAWTQPIASGGVGAQYGGLCANRDGSISAAVGSELVVFEASGVERARLDAPSRITALAPGDEHAAWIGLIDGIARIRNGVIERYVTGPPISVPVKALLDDGHGALWIGTGSGPVRVSTASEGAGSIVIGSSGEMPGGFDVRSAVLDREGNVWLGANAEGLVRLRPQHLRTYGAHPGHSQVLALCDDGAGGAWFCGECQGLEHVVAGEPESRREPLELPGEKPSCVQSLLRDHLGRLWLGVNDQVLRRAPGAGSAFTPILDGRIFAPKAGRMVETPAGDVWIATSAGHLLRIGPDDQLREELDVPGGLLALAAASDGSLWIGSENCVRRWSAGRFETYGHEVGLPNGSVRDLLLDEDGVVWIATYGGGLARLANGRIQKLSRNEGLPDNALTRILDDGHGRLWILANLGLIVAEREELRAVLSGERRRLEPVLLGPEAGLNEGNFGAPAGFRGADGRLWFGTLGGVACVNAREFPFNRTPPKLRIERLLADDIELPLGTQVRVPAGTRRLVVEFTAFALAVPERVRFRYRLEGYDPDWVDGGALRRASFSTLVPGDYTLRVMARNEEGVWSTEPASLELTVLPSWWQTLSFQLAAVLCVAGALLAFHRLRIRGVRRRAHVLLEATRERGLAEERASRLREELAHVARVATAGELATSLAHEVNQPLAAIVANAQAGRRFLARESQPNAGLDEILTDIAQQGQRASEVIRRLREFLRKHPPKTRALAVSEVVRATLPLVRRELEDHRAQLVLDLAEGLPAVQADEVELQQVLVNLVKNACEAMAGSRDERRVELRTSRQADQVRIEVRDTGPGIAAEISSRLFQPFVTTKENGMGLGLAICRSIIEAREGKLSVAPAAGGGVVFRIDLPVHEEAEVLR